MSGRYPDSHTYSWEEITVSIPDAWKGKYEVVTSEDGFSLIQSVNLMTFTCPAILNPAAGMRVMCRRPILTRQCLAR